MKDNQKSELIQDLMSVETVLEEVYRYHPENPKKKDVVEEYKNLNKMKSDIEKELNDLDA